MLQVRCHRPHTRCYTVYTFCIKLGESEHVYLLYICKKKCCRSTIKSPEVSGSGPEMKLPTLLYIFHIASI